MTTSRLVGPARWWLWELDTPTQKAQEPSGLSRLTLRSLSLSDILINTRPMDMSLSKLLELVMDREV